MLVENVSYFCKILYITCDVIVVRISKDVLGGSSTLISSAKKSSPSQLATQYDYLARVNFQLAIWEK